MAKLSRNKRKAARIKRDRTGVAKELRNTYATLIRTHMALLGVLAQCGGEKEVTVGTLQQVSVGMGWTMHPKPLREGETATSEYVVRIVTPEDDNGVVMDEVTE